MELKEIIEGGHVEALEELLLVKPEYSNRKIVWGEDQKNKTDPLHYVSDCVFNGLLTNGSEIDVVKTLIAHGADINGSKGAESPLIGAVSLSVEGVANVLIDAGADINVTSVHGANSLHWAAYVGLPGLVKTFINMGADIERKCVDFQATPLFWAVQGFGTSHEIDKSTIIAAAEVLVGFGANVKTENYAGVSVFEKVRQMDDEALIRVIGNGV